MDRLIRNSYSQRTSAPKNIELKYQKNLSYYHLFQEEEIDKTENKKPAPASEVDKNPEEVKDRNNLLKSFSEIYGLYGYDSDSDDSEQ